MRTLLAFELKKLLRHKSLIGVFMVGLLALFGLFYMNFFNSQISGYSMDKVHGREAVAVNRQFAEEHSGELSTDLLTKVIKDYTLSIESNSPTFNVFGYYVLSRFDSPFRNYYFNLDKGESIDFSKIKPKLEKQIGSVLPFKELKLGNFAPWHQLFIVSNGAYILILLSSIYLIAPVFSGDYDKKMNPLLLTTTYGRNKLTKAKVMSSYSISILLFVSFYAIILAVFAWYFGFSGWDTSVQLNLYWINSHINIMNFPEHITLLETLFYLVTHQFMGLIFIAAVTVFVSSKTKSPLTTFAISVGAIFVPSFLLQVFQDGFIHKLLIVLSVSTSDTAGLMLRLSSDWPMENFWFNGGLLIGMRLLLVGILLYFTYQSIKRVQK